MNVYDPADSIVYRHTNPRSDLCAATVTRTPSVARLPAGYMNRSPRTRLTFHAGRVA